MLNNFTQNIEEQIIIEYQEDGVFLTVLPPEMGMLPSSNDIVAEIQERKIENADLSVVKKAIESPGEPYILAPPQDEVTIDGTCRVELSKDKMEAYLFITPPRGGKPVSREEISSALSEKGVVFGIDDEVIDVALSMEKMDEPLVVARGQLAVDGQSAKIEYKFNPKGMPGRPKELVDGRVDFYNLGLIQTVEAGDVLAEKIPATEGIPGSKVSGEELLPRKGKDVNLLAGKNVELVNDGLKAVATASGHVLLSGNKITVSAVLEVKGDVDFSTGNIDFNGSVVVKGMVNDGFTVKAEGDIEIQGSVSGGFIHCGGNLKIKSGLVGRNKGMIICRGSVYTQFIENASVSAGEDVVVGEAIMHSNISSGRTVTVGGKGVIVGGVVRAGEEILAKVVGSNLATATELETGVNPQLRLKYAKTKSELSSKETELDKVDKAIKLLKKMHQVSGDLPQDKKQILVQVSQTHVQLLNDVEELRKQKEELEVQIKQSERGRIMVEKIMYSGVKITIGSASLHNREDLSFVCLTKQDEEIQISPYK